MIHPQIRTIEPPRFPPYGLLQLAAITDQWGFKIAVLDNNSFRLPIDAVRQTVKEDQWDIIGIGGLTTQYKYIKKLVPICREEHPDALIVGGGGFITAQPYEMLRWLPDLDIGCIGESYITWQEVMEHFDDRNWKKVKGLVYRQGKKIKMSKMRPLIPEEKLDEEIPFPAYEFSPVETYLMNSRIPYSPEAMAPNCRRLSVLSSYGCPWRCTFCSHNGSSPYDQSKIYGKKVVGKEFRQHTPQYVVNLITHLRLTYGINFVSFIDENLTVNKKWFFEFCDKLEESGLATLIHWGMVCHTRTVDAELLQKARDVGCSYVSYGGESASAKLLKQMKKGQTKEVMGAAIEATQAAGINPIMSFIVGFPNTTMDDLIEDCQFYIDYQIHVRPFLLQPYPGSELYRKYKEQIIEQHLTREEKEFLTATKPTLDIFTKVFGETEIPSRTKLQKNLLVLKEKVKDNALERWVLSLDDATKLSANLTDFNDVELAGLRYMLSAWELERLKKFRSGKESPKKISYIK